MGAGVDADEEWLRGERDRSLCTETARVVVTYLRSEKFHFEIYDPLLLFVGRVPSPSACVMVASSD